MVKMRRQVWRTLFSVWTIPFLVLQTQYTIRWPMSKKPCKYQYILDYKVKLCWSLSAVDLALLSLWRSKVAWPYFCSFFCSLGPFPLLPNSHRGWTHSRAPAAILLWLSFHPEPFSTGERQNVPSATLHSSGPFLPNEFCMVIKSKSHNNNLHLCKTVQLESWKSYWEVSSVIKYLVVVFYAHIDRWSFQIQNDFSEKHIQGKLDTPAELCKTR